MSVWLSSIHLSFHSSVHLFISHLSSVSFIIYLSTYLLLGFKMSPQTPRYEWTRENPWVRIPVWYQHLCRRKSGKAVWILNGSENLCIPNTYSLENAAELTGVSLRIWITDGNKGCAWWDLMVLGQPGPYRPFIISASISFQEELLRIGCKFSRLVTKWAKISR